MAITGATFNFTKKVSEEEQVSTASAPTDGNTPKPDLAGEGKKKDNLRTIVGLQEARKVGSAIAQNIISNVEGTTTQAQISALNSGVSTVASVATTFAVNPILGLANLTAQGVSYVARQEKFNRDKAWTDYELEQYKQLRGYSSLYNGSRKR